MSHKYYQGEEWWIDDNFEPAWWEKYSLAIIGDGYHIESGIRIHIVHDSYTWRRLRELADKTGMKHVILTNAIIVSEEYFNEHFKEKEE